jgi:hypothetical protein
MEIDVMVDAVSECLSEDSERAMKAARRDRYLVSLFVG